MSRARSRNRAGEAAGSPPRYCLKPMCTIISATSAALGHRHRLDQRLLLPRRSGALGAAPAQYLVGPLAIRRTWIPTGTAVFCDDRSSYSDSLTDGRGAGRPGRQAGGARRGVGGNAIPDESRGGNPATGFPRGPLSVTGPATAAGIAAGADPSRTPPSAVSADDLVLMSTQYREVGARLRRLHPIMPIQQH